MLLEPTVGEQALLAEALRRDTTALSRRERTTEVLAAVAFVGVVAALVIAQPPREFDPVSISLCVLVLAVATRVRFHVASGFTVPTQLAFVPMLLVLPVSIVPLAVMLSFVLGRVPTVLSGHAEASRLVPAASNAWFAMGPAAVFVAFGVEPWKAGAGILLLALLAQFVVDFVSSAARDAIQSGTSVLEQFRESWVYAVDAALSPIALAAAYEVHAHPVTVLGLLPLLGVFASFARERRARLEGLLELKDAYQGTALVLGDVVGADDGYTGEHCKSVVRLAIEVGTHLRLDSDQIRNLEFGALLHDVGKVAIPKEIINKPVKLDPHEWTIIKTHTIEGQRMLDRVGGFMRTVGLVVRSHHERWDGGGYPDGLRGDEIPIESRIITCCDAWNAMRTTRPYRKAMSHQAAVDELVGNSGGQFDPTVVEALLDVVGREAQPHPAVTGDADPFPGPQWLNSLTQ